MSGAYARAVACKKAGQGIVTRRQRGSSGTVIGARYIAGQRRRKRLRRDTADVAGCCCWQDIVGELGRAAGGKIARLQRDSDRFTGARIRVVIDALSGAYARAVACKKSGQGIVIRCQCGSSGAVIGTRDIAGQRRRNRNRRRRDAAGDLACVEHVAENGLAAAVCGVNGDVAE